MYYGIKLVALGEALIDRNAKRHFAIVVLTLAEKGKKTVAGDFGNRCVIGITVHIANMKTVADVFAKHAENVVGIASVDKSQTVIDPVAADINSRYKSHFTQLLFKTDIIIYQKRR